jgi:hypothetical protein
MVLTPRPFRRQAGLPLRSFPCLLAACLVVALVAPGSASAQTAARKALINGDTVVGSPSQEEQIATDLGLAVTVVDDSTWRPIRPLISASTTC